MIKEKINNILILSFKLSKHFQVQISQIKIINNYFLNIKLCTHVYVYKIVKNNALVLLHKMINVFPYFVAKIVSNKKKLLCLDRSRYLQIFKYKMEKMI